jgi:pilus assembly protein Flp/PilA
MTQLLSRFAHDETGATAIEYALIGALIALAILVGVGAVGNNLAVRFQNVADEVENAGP